MVKINKKELIQEGTLALEHKTEECHQVLWALKKWFKVKKRKMDSKEIILALLIIMGL